MEVEVSREHFLGVHKYSVVSEAFQMSGTAFMASAANVE